MTATLTARPRSLLTPATTAAGAGVYLGAVALIDPFQERTVNGVTIGCPIHGATGGYCPGCGSTRAVHELIRGDVVGSLVCHPLVIPIVGLLAYLWISWVARRRAGVGPPPAWARSPLELPAAMPLLLGVAFVVLTVVRNVPGMEWLTPPDVAP